MAIVYSDGVNFINEQITTFPLVLPDVPNEPPGGIPPTHDQLDGEVGHYIGSNGSFYIEDTGSLTFDAKITVFQDKQIFFFETEDPDLGEVLFNRNTVEEINVMWFGAIPNDDTKAASNVVAIQRAINCAINSAGCSVVYFPHGDFYIDEPLLLVNRELRTVVIGGVDEEVLAYTFFNITLRGSQHSYGNFTAKLKSKIEIPFILGVQGARGVTIDNLSLEGYLAEVMPETAPNVPFNKFNESDLIYLTSDALYPPDATVPRTSSQKLNAPLCAIVVDPFEPTVPPSERYLGLDEFYEFNPTHVDIDPADYAGNSTKIVIKNSVIRNFPNGIAFSPNGRENNLNGIESGTQQGDSIAIDNCRINNVINGIITCQDQARRLVVQNCDFGRMKYGFNGDEFGKRRGIMPEVSNLKYSDSPAWLYRFTQNNTYGHFSSVYCEGMYGIGYCGSDKQPVSFVNCVFKLRERTDPVKNYLNPFVMFGGSASMVGCTLTIGGASSIKEPLSFAVQVMTYLSCYLDSMPVNIGNTPPVASHFTNTDINSNLRASRDDNKTWCQVDLNDMHNPSVDYDPVSELFFFTALAPDPTEDIIAFVKDETFVFGRMNMGAIPFNTADSLAMPTAGIGSTGAGVDRIVCFGIVKDVIGNVVYFENNFLNPTHLPMNIRIMKNKELTCV